MYMETAVYYITFNVILCAAGIDTFPGTKIHSWEYKDPDPYHGKRVVVVGIGNSGGDIAVELSRTCEKASKI